MLAPINRRPSVSVAETLSGAPGIVDLWYWRYEPATEAALNDTCGPLLSAEERDRHRALRFERDRCLFLATRLLVRTSLSRYAAVSRSDWRFSASPSGKPRVEGPAVRPTLHFNLANTPGLVVCAVSVTHASIGVDAERIDREVDFRGLAARYFSPAEAQALGVLPPGEVARGFFTYWTLKESYVKARGLGLALPIDRVSFSIHDDIVDVAFHDPEDRGAGWSFASIDVPPDHLVAVAADTGPAALSLRAAHLDPLAPVESTYA